MKGIECACFGAIGSDVIELKMSKAEKPWTAFNLAVDTGDEKSTWIRVSCFGEVAERVAATFKKNDRAYIEGLIRLDHWQDKHGEQKHGLSVSAFKVEKVGVSAIGRNKPPRQDRVDAPLASSNHGPLQRHRQQAEAAPPGAKRDKPKVVGRDDFDFNDRLPF